MEEEEARHRRERAARRYVVPSAAGEERPADGPIPLGLVGPVRLGLVSALLSRKPVKLGASATADAVLEGE